MTQGRGSSSAWSQGPTSPPGPSGDGEGTGALLGQLPAGVWEPVLVLVSLMRVCAVAVQISHRSGCLDVPLPQHPNQKIVLYFPCQVLSPNCHMLFPCSFCMEFSALRLFRMKSSVQV